MITEGKKLVKQGPSRRAQRHSGSQTGECQQQAGSQTGECQQQAGSQTDAGLAVGW